MCVIACNRHIGADIIGCVFCILLDFDLICCRQVIPYFGYSICTGFQVRYRLSICCIVWQRQRDLRIRITNRAVCIVILQIISASAGYRIFECFLRTICRCFAIQMLLDGDAACYQPIHKLCRRRSICLNSTTDSPSCWRFQ